MKKLTLDELRSLGKRACLEIEAGLEARSSLRERWRVLEAHYRNEPGASGTTVHEDIPAEHVPLTQPLCRRIIDSVWNAITSQSPIASALDCESSENASVLAAQYDLMLSRSGFPRAFKRLLVPTTVNGIGFSYMRLDERKGFVVDSIPPNDIVITPTANVSIDSCVMVGHRFFVTMQEAYKRVEDNEWADHGTFIETSADEYESSRSAAFDKSNAQVDTSEGDKSSTKTMECWQVFWYTDLSKEVGGDKVCRWHRLTIDKAGERVLSIDEWPYSRPPYFDFRHWDEEVKFWPASSVANNLQTLQNRFSDLWNLWYAGIMVKAFPATFVSGVQLPPKTLKATPGAIYEAEAQMSVQTIPGLFDGAGMLESIQKVEQMAESVAGIPTAGTGQSGDPNQTATLTAYNQSMQMQSESSYASMDAYPVEDMLKFMHEVCQAHTATIARIYEKTLKPGFIAALEEEPRFEVTGKVATKSSRAQIDAAQILLGMTQDPRTRLKYPELERRVVGLLNMEASEEILYDDEEFDAGMAQGGGMGLVPGGLEAEAGQGAAGFDDLSGQSGGVIAS